MLRKLEDVITFGKHKGKTVEDVYFEDAKYLSWLKYPLSSANAFLSN